MKLTHKNNFKNENNAEPNTIKAKLYQVTPESESFL